MWVLILPGEVDFDTFQADAPQVLGVFETVSEAEAASALFNVANSDLAARDARYRELAVVAVPQFSEVLVKHRALREARDKEVAALLKKLKKQTKKRKGEKRGS